MFLITHGTEWPIVEHTREQNFIIVRTAAIGLQRSCDYVNRVMQAQASSQPANHVLCCVL